MDNSQDTSDFERTAQPTSTGGKRTETERSTAGMPPKPKKKKFTKRAIVWQHYTQREEDSPVANCNYCTTAIACDTVLNGTSAMRGHISKCKPYLDFEEAKRQKVLGQDNSGNMKMIKYDPQAFRRAVNEMVVVNELPFSFVESEGWKRFVHNMLPMYQTFSRKTCSRDIVAMYVEEKEALKTTLKSDQRRVSITTDIWTSPVTSFNYMVVTGHWVDSDWKLQKRILGFKVITDHRGETICGHLVDCLTDWGIEKVFTVTVDNAKSNDKALKLFKDHMNFLGTENLVLGGELLHMRCCAHILNLIVGDGLKKSRDSIVAVRNAVKYVRSSFPRLQSFELKCASGKFLRGCLPLDVITRWNSTYLMLSSALKMQGAFERMEAEDKLYCEYFLQDDENKTTRVGPPVATDWDDVKRLVKFLKIFYKCTVAFSSSKKVTSTHCYNEIITIARNLTRKCASKDEETKMQALVMKDKFEKYWNGLINMNPLVIIASVFDPRNKMTHVSICFDELYGKDSENSKKLYASTSSVLKKLYDEYSQKLKKVNESQASGGDSSMHPTYMGEESDEDDDYVGGDAIYKTMENLNRNVEGSITELDIYLAEQPEPRVENSLGLEYDVLSWWKCSASKFPVLSEMARDILAIQVSSVASESAFSTTGRVLDPYRSSLTPFMVEVLLCTQQWLRCNYKGETEVSNLTQMLEEVEFFDSLDIRSSVPADPAD